MNQFEWLIWSNEHHAWWKPKEAGYITKRGGAGRYSYERACDIVYNANKHQSFDKVPNETMVRVESGCCNAPLVDGAQCLNCGEEDDFFYEKVCETCGGTGEITTMERVYPNEPHMAPVGTAPCPDCQRRD